MLQPFLALTRKSLVLGLALCGLLCALCPGSSQAQPQIRLESVVLRPMLEAEVPAQQTGLLQEIVVTEGESVTAGQVLASLDSRVAQMAVKRAELEVVQAEARASNQTRIDYAEKALEVARAELKRSSESIEKFAKSISQSQLDVEQLTVEKLILERQQAEHELLLERIGLQLIQTELDAARLTLQQHQLRAPFDGTVVLVRGRVGEWVELGGPVLRIVAIATLRAEGFMSAEMVNSTLVGRPVRFVVDSRIKQQEHTGTLKFVSPEIDPVTRQVRVWAEIDNRQGLLRPGQQGVLETVKQP